MLSLHPDIVIMMGQVTWGRQHTCLSCVWKHSRLTTLRRVPSRLISEYNPKEKVETTKVRCHRRKTSRVLRPISRVTGSRRARENTWSSKFKRPLPFCIGRVIMCVVFNHSFLSRLTKNPSKMLTVNPSQPTMVTEKLSTFAAPYTDLTKKQG